MHIVMRNLIEKFRIKLEETPTEFIRSIDNKIEWDEPLVAILGARGVGKSTLILQHIKLHDEIEKTLYVSTDDLYFTDHTLYGMATEFYKNGGKNLYIDEIHKYRNWSQEIKNINDTYSRLKVVYTGSSIIELQKGSHDLSRRLLDYHMYGLSFREFLEMKYEIRIERHSLEQIIENKISFPYELHRPVALFKEYLREGYYPYFVQKEYYSRLCKVVNRVTEVDIPMATGISVSTVAKLRKLLYIIIKSVPFKPNYTKIGRDLNVSRNMVSDLIVWLEKAGLLNMLREASHTINSLGRVDKVYLSNPNLSYALSDSEPETGNVRETIFLALTKVNHTVVASKESDFRIGKYTFEVGGKSKKQYQIRDLEDAFIVKDDIEYGYSNILPLWAFGLLY